MTKLRQVLPHGVMLAASVLLYWAAARIEPGTGGRIGPGVWPKAIIVFMGLLCAYEIVKRLMGARSEAKGVIAEIRNPALEAAPEPAARTQPEPAHRMLWWGLALVTAYVLLVPWIGFATGTFLFLWLFPLAGGLWRPATVALVAAAGTLVLVVVFMRIAYISLPLGEGPFKALSILVMKLVGSG